MSETRSRDYVAAAPDETMIELPVVAAAGPGDSPDIEQRRAFFRNAARLFGGAAAAMVALPAGVTAMGLEHALADEPAATVSDAPEFDEIEARNVVIRMQKELQRAMARPIEERRWVMVIDLRKCTGCGACTISCIAENQLPPGVVYRPVIEEEIGRFPNVSARSIPRPCMQCENPPCVPVCPVKATFVRPDGIIDMDYTRCIGCRYCMTACPYHARTFDFGLSYSDGTPARQPYEEAANYEYSNRWVRKGHSSPVGNVRKCHFCTHKLDAGMLPSCVTTCIGYATYFGDANDPGSLVAELISRPNKMRLKEEMGTLPRVYYLV
jgi:Fe-S-cluster-containing dehydrogenase component